MNIKEVFSGVDTYVMCSTLNQIVNYIPIKLIEKYNENSENIKIFNITLRSQSEKNDIFKRFDNEKWDKNLESVLGEPYKIHPIYIQKNRLEIGFVINDKNDGIEKLNEANIKKFVIPTKGKIIWNITGGQRSTIFAIQKYIRENNERTENYIIYLEGNSNRIVCGRLKDNDFEYELIDELYEVKDLNLQKTFQLAGFKIRNYNKKCNMLKDKLKGKEYEEFKLCKRFYKYYKESESKRGKEIRKYFSKLNKKDNDMEEVVEGIWRALEKFHLKDEFNDEDDKNLLLSIKGKQIYKFGYILEYMALASIIDCIEGNKKENYFVELIHSANLDKFNNPFKERNTSELCEFDIVLLSKSGQVVFFECKSGTMDSNAGKARNYTAYAAGGVYGKPILITPLLKNELKIVYDAYKSDEENKVGKNIQPKDIYEDKELNTTYDREVLEDILKAIRAAARANLEIWGIDEIGERLQILYKESMQH